MLDSLSFGQYNLVYNMLSFTTAAMFASFIFFVMARQQVSPKYQTALIMSSLVVAVAGYHYWRISNSFSDAYILEGSIYRTSGIPFNDGYRYVDWLLTVPLLVAELVAVLGLTASKRGSMTARLAVAAALMVLLGYPGEISNNIGTRALWGAISTIPFVYILWVLWGELGTVIQNQTERVRILLRNTRLVLLATWGFYPIVYMLPFIGLTGGTSFTAVQVGYTIADVAAKAGYGLLIYAIARAKTEADAAAGDPIAATVVGSPVMVGR